MANVRKDRALYIDLELTCWEGGVIPEGQFREIIQVGVVEVDTNSLQITRESSYYVKPQMSEVSSYCTSLTGITQRTIDKQGRPFFEVLNSIQKKFGAKNKITFAYGDDQSEVEHACDCDGLTSPFNFVNLAAIFAIERGLEKSVSLVFALATMGLEFHGKQHNALTDANNLARLHVEMMRRIRRNANV